MSDEPIDINEDFPYSNLTDEQLIEKIKELSNKLLDFDEITDVNKAIYYSEIAISELHNRQLLEQTKLYQSQIKLLQTQLDLAQKSIDNSKKDSKSARSFAIWALVVSALFGLPDACTYFKIEYRPNETTYQDTSLQLQERQLSKQDSLLKSLNQIRNDIQVYGQQSKELGHKKVYGK